MASKKKQENVETEEIEESIQLIYCNEIYNLFDNEINCSHQLLPVWISSQIGTKSNRPQVKTASKRKSNRPHISNRINNYVLISRI
jgi:hypothetical protein